MAIKEAEQVDNQAKVIVFGDISGYGVTQSIPTAVDTLITTSTFIIPKGTWLIWAEGYVTGLGPGNWIRFKSTDGVLYLQFKETYAGGDYTNMTGIFTFSEDTTCGLYVYAGTACTITKYAGCVRGIKLA